MVVEESAMTDEVLNTLVVLGHRLLLVEVGGGFRNLSRGLRHERG
jgi:hypothetical protein